MQPMTAEKPRRGDETSKVAGISGEVGSPRTTALPIGTASQKSGRDSAQDAIARTFSRVVSVLMRDRNFRNARLGTLEWLVLPPVLAGQWQMGQAGVERGSGAGDTRSSALIPVTVALWARVSPAVDKRLSESCDKPLVLKPDEWTSGDIYWLIALAGDRRAMPTFLTALQQGEFKGRDVKLRAGGRDGTSVVKTLAAFIEEAK